MKSATENVKKIKGKRTYNTVPYLSKPYTWKWTRVVQTLLFKGQLCCISLSLHGQANSTASTVQASNTTGFGQHHLKPLAM